MNHVSTAHARSYDQEMAHYERAVHQAESTAIEDKERRSYTLTTGDVLLWMLSVPAVLTFLGACVWAIASNG